MKHKINPKFYKEVSEIDFHGHHFVSFYNHNYYYNEKNDTLIVEECDDDDYFLYSFILPSENGDFKWKFIGSIYSIFGIFSKHYDGKLNQNGEVEFV